MDRKNNFGTLSNEMAFSNAAKVLLWVVKWIFQLVSMIQADWESRILQMKKIDKVTTLIVEHYITLLLHVCVDMPVKVEF